MKRRDFILLAGAMAFETGWEAVKPAALMAAPSHADFTIRIAPASLELAPGKTIRTIGYNGSVPGPVLQMKEGKEITVDVFNDTAVPEVVHWHGQLISSEADGSMEEGTPAVPPHGHRSYTFSPRPAGTRWYHTHAMAGRNLSRGTYTGQFGFVYIEPKNDPGRFDQEQFLALHDWEPFLTSEEEEEEEEGDMMGDVEIEPAAFRASQNKEKSEGEKENGLEVGYKSFSINGHSLGHGEPIRVREGQRVLFHLLNASATEIRKLALPGHKFTVVTMDGNPVPTPAAAEVLQIAPGERIDAIVEMKQPGVWILGTTHDDDRNAGMGIVVEYSGQSGAPKWIAPPKTVWDYTAFGKTATAPEPHDHFDLVFRKIAGGKTGFNRWTINGKSFPHTDPLVVHSGTRYRLRFKNESDDAHPVHLHRHIFELTSVDGRQTSGLMKDTVVVRPNGGRVAVDFVADNPGLTLFHCHQQMHMDYGFMTLIKYA